MKYLRILICGLALDCSALPALANFTFTQGGTTTMFSFDTATGGTSVCTTAECPASVPINTAGAPMFVTGTPGLVTGVGGTFPVTQATAGNLNATVVGTGTFATQLTGATNNINNISGTISLPTGAATGIADKGTWTVSSTNFTLTGGQFTTAGATACATGQACTSAMTADRSLFVNMQDYAGSALSASNPLPSQLSIGGAVVSATNPLFVNGVGIANGTTYSSQTFSWIGTQQAGATAGQLNGLISCTQHGFKHITSATDTLAVPLVSGQTTYLCSYASSAAGTATWYFEDAAATGCTSTLTQLTGLNSEAANTGRVIKSAYWDGIKTTAAHDLCIKSTGTGGVDVDYWYAQF
jgi:hypothetical protein